MRFAGHEAELDDGEAADGCENEAGKTQRAEIRLHCKRNKEVCDGTCDGKEWHQLRKRDAVMQKA